ncbi:ABC transporter ATP-binding protein [Xanthobacter aminoxidans]|uniref:ABC transporter ATP-binding protein n=1 Tax=Xanthobacter aminoxidans TaxID=186280 RepID=UPI003728BA5D
MSTTAVSTTATSALLEVRDLSVSFGGVKALQGVSFDVKAGEIFSIIGPNGAGKTTIFNCLSGLFRPTAGSIRLDGRELVGLPPKELAALGVARTFQNLGLFEHLSVMDNVLLGRHHLMQTSILSNALRLRSTGREERAHRERVADILELFGLAREARTEIGVLPYGVRKLIEIARALAMEPKLLLLDEPVAGMNHEETARISEAILDVRRRERTGMVLVEHDMRMVMTISDRLMAIDFGQHVATGHPHEIQNNPRVIEAYLGRAA